MSERIIPCHVDNAEAVRDANAGGPKDEDRSSMLRFLDERLRFETVLSRLSATFINLAAEEVDSQIERGLQQIVEFLDIERSSLTQFSEDGSELIVTHSYTIPGFIPMPRVNLAVMWPWYTAKVRAGEILRFSRLPDEAPPEALCEQDNYRLRGGPRSHLAIPFKVGQSILGCIGFGSIRQERDWPDDLVQSLQLVGEVFANALARKRAEEQSRSLREQLARVGRVTLVSELAASIAHEVNQPLCAIVSNAQATLRNLGKTEPHVAEVREALEDIVADGQRASAVIARVRSFLQRSPLPRLPVDVNDLIREVSALMRSEMTRRGIAVQLELAHELPWVHGDRVQLQQVLVNLLVNAADAMDTVHRDLRELLVRSTADLANTVTVAVQDVGSGIEPRARDHIFEALFTTKSDGSGMGLAICKSIVEAHGGRVWADSISGVGTTVRFTLPAHQEGVP
jgi:signal transduction histidine kinase